MERYPKAFKHRVVVPIGKANEAKALVHYRNASTSPSLLSKLGTKSGSVVVEHPRLLKTRLVAIVEAY
jgi:hypothetical protein